MQFSSREIFWFRSTN